MLANWRSGALPNKPNKPRPAVVVGESGLFAPAYRNVVLVPTTDDARLVIQDLAVLMEPSVENRCTKRCWPVAHLVTTTSKAQLRRTPSRVTAAELSAIRRRIAEAIGAA